MPKDQIHEYLNSLEKKLNNRKVVDRSFAQINDFLLPLGQCFYILDYKSNSITFSKGIERMLGYSEKEFNTLVLIDMIHPDDRDMAGRLIKATLMFATENNVSSNVGFFVTYRVRHKNGKYIKVLRQSNIFEHDENGRIISNLSLLTDISFLNLSNKVEWKFDAPGLDKQKFKKYVTKEYSNFFSERELEIIKLLNKGLTSKDIAGSINISKHTVDTHRRKILNKSNCDNTIDLLNFCKNNGIL